MLPHIYSYCKINFCVWIRVLYDLEGGKFGIEYNLSEEFITEILKSRQCRLQQEELLPMLPMHSYPKPVLEVPVSRGFFTNLAGGMEAVKRELDPADLAVRFMLTDKTLEQTLEDIIKWYKNLSSRDLLLWLKLFAFAQFAKQYGNRIGSGSTDADGILKTDATDGLYRILFTADKNFLKHFLKPYKKSSNKEKYQTKTKKQLIQNLFRLSKQEIIFPIIEKNKETTKITIQSGIKVFEMAEQTITNKGKEKKLFAITLNSNILDAELKNYIKIDIKETEKIMELWEKHTENAECRKLRLSQFGDIALKFSLFLTGMYNPKNNYENNGYLGNKIKIGRDKLDERLGNLFERVREHLVKNNFIRSYNSNSDKINKAADTILKKTFKIMEELGYIKNSKYNPKKNLHEFQLNRFFFNKNAAIKELKACLSAVIIRNNR